MKAVLSAGILLCTISLAQAQQPSAPAPTAPPAATTVAPSAVPGTSQFSETQARAAMTDAGYISITGLTLGQDGIWRGRGTRSGDEHDVTLDAEGKVHAKPRATP